jgi:molybdopterin synthase catalytic subunit
MEFGASRPDLAVGSEAAVRVSSDSWLALTVEPLDIGAIHDWAVVPSCGAVVVFSGAVRDHAEHRTGVTLIDYEAYESQVVPKLADIEVELRSRFDQVGRVALLHRVGPLALSEISVVVAVSAAHRPQAFEAARYGIDAIKASVPIWKRETHDGGSDWGLAATDIGAAALVAPSETVTSSQAAQ